MQRFSHLAHLDVLYREDFRTWYHFFKKVVGDNVPNFENLLFIGREDDLSSYFRSKKLIRRLERYFNDESGTSELFLSVDQAIFFSVKTYGEPVVAAITGIDEYFARRVSMDWLRDLSKQLYEHFLLIKKSGSDLETGLPNATHFFRILEEFHFDPLPSIILVEIYPRVRSSMDSQIHKAKVVRSLKSCLNNPFSLYYLGHHVFALLLPHAEKSSCRTIGKRILAWLRRDGFRKVHLGLRWGGLPVLSEKNQVMQDLMDQANYALTTARKRGPFSLCDYSHLSQPEHHPLRKASRKVMARFRRKWKDIDSFTVIALKPAILTDKTLIEKEVSDEYLICADEDIYLFFADLGVEEADSLCTKLLQNLNLGEIQRGIAHYPHLNFSKSTVVYNSRKAISHAAFFGANGKAVFDEVSLNISGDIYYAEGDLTSAVKEYKAGLNCDSENLNLLNSLGVAYADMDKHKDARNCFEKVLAIDPENFMALYNSGLEAEQTRRSKEALDYFEKALALSGDKSDQVIDTDLSFRVGRLCALTGKYTEAVQILTNVYHNSAKSQLDERALPYLGLSCYGLKEYGKAINWLQKALQYNEFDAESMGLLGLCYLLEGQGDEIALSLCEKSVEIAPDNGTLKIYLVQTQIACKLHDRAKVTLNKCLRQRATRQQAQLLSCMNFMAQGKLSRAKFWLDKLYGNETINPEIAEQAEKIREELDGI